MGVNNGEMGRVPRIWSIGDANANTAQNSPKRHFKRKNHFFLGQDLASSPYLSRAVQLFSGLHASAKEAVRLRVVLVGLHEQTEKSLQNIVFDYHAQDYATGSYNFTMAAQ